MLAPSPTRTYIAQCNKADFTGYYFRKFSLPDRDPYTQEPYENSNTTASWYFLNRLNFVACIEGVIAFEDFKLEEQKGT